MSGKVYLVGAGPGDPELLTVKALRLLQRAHAVLHDDLVSPDILQLISPSARVYNVGKRCGQKSVRQEEINFLMTALALSGLQVVRLKGGDPLLFGRAGEELEALQRADIEYEIVPGVTAALAAAAFAAIPLTHRRKSSALVLIAGHRADNSEAEWKRLVSSGATLVIYMPGRDYAEISAKLIGAGLHCKTPCALISRASTPAQQIYRTRVSQLTDAPSMDSPTILIVGEVVGAQGSKAGEANALEDIEPMIQSAFLNDAFEHAENRSNDEERHS